MSCLRDLEQQSSSVPPKSCRFISISLVNLWEGWRVRASFVLFFSLYYGPLILVTSFPKCPPGNFSSLSRPLTPVLYLPEVRLRTVASFDYLSSGPPATPTGRDSPAPFVVQLSGRVLPCPSREGLPWEREEERGQSPDNGAHSLAELGASIFMSASSNGGRGGTLVAIFFCVFYFFLEAIGHRRKKEQQKQFMPLN